MSPTDPSKEDKRSPIKSDLVKFGAIGIYAEDTSQAWGALLTFATLFIWFVYINNNLGDLVFRSIFIVGISVVSTYLIYKFWTMVHRKILKRWWPLR